MQSAKRSVPHHTSGVIKIPIENNWKNMLALGEKKRFGGHTA